MVWDWMVWAGTVWTGTVLEGFLVMTDVSVPEDWFDLFLPVEYRSFLCAPAVIVTAMSAINNTDFFITVPFLGLFPMQK